MSDPLSQLQPRELWSHFAALSAIPRPSRHEERVVAWVHSLASERDWDVRSDSAGNLIVAVPASPGHERAAIVVLQSHLDMVCDKNEGVQHDFMKDPIVPWVDGEWVRARGTTLGADNGIGVAAALASATDTSVVHGPLELLFTLDEETGLNGALGLDGKLVHGRTLLNLDSEEDGKIFIGCAGGVDGRLHLAVDRVPAPPDHIALTVGVRGLRGGHSGLEIHENRGNALKLLVRLLLAGQESGLDLQLSELRGGTKHNAIPREATATIVLSASDEPRFRSVVACMLEGMRTELRGVDDGLDVQIASTSRATSVATRTGRDRLLRLMAALPHGVLGMSRDLPGLVETSSNLAVVQPEDGGWLLVTSSRSSVMPTLRAVQGAVRAAGELAGARVESADGYPGWKPDVASPLLAVVRDVYADLWGGPPVVTAVHAGLECGLLGERIPGIDMVSFGPQIEGAHSPDERVHVPSVERFWTALTRVLKRLASPSA